MDSGRAPIRTPLGRVFAKSADVPGKLADEALEEDRPGTTEQLDPKSAVNSKTKLTLSVKMLLETDRLLIRNWTADDWKLVQPMASDPLVMRYIGHYQPWPEEETQQFVHDRIRDYERHGWTMWPLTLKENGEFIGYCGFLWRKYGEYKGEIEMGYAIARDHWGNGLMAEAGTKIIEYGFETLDFNRVIASARQENTASIRVMQKMGMVSIGDSLNDKGIPRPHYDIENPGH